MANRLVSIASTASGSSPSTWGTVPGLSASGITVQGTESVLLLIASVVPTAAADAAAQLRFTVDGSPITNGPTIILATDSTNGERGGATLVYAITGLSGSHSFGVEWQTQTTAVSIDTGVNHSFQVIEFVAGATIRVDSYSTGSGTSPGTEAALFQSTGIPVAGTGSILMMLANVPLAYTTADGSVAFRFGVDGTPEGARGTATLDSAVVNLGWSGIHIKTGVSTGNHSFELNWQTAAGTAQNNDTGQTRTFQVIEFDGTGVAILDSIITTTATTPGTAWGNDSTLDTDLAVTTDALHLVIANACRNPGATDGCVDISIGINDAEVGGASSMYVDSTSVFQGSCVAWCESGLTGTNSFQMRHRYIQAGSIHTSYDRSLFVLELTEAQGISGVTPDEFDMDNVDVDVESAPGSFDASGNDVYISDADTLAGSLNEVDISSAINTESATLINLDLTQLSGTELGNLQTLGPGARYIIVNTTGGEYSWPITLHRPQAFIISDSASLTNDGATTARLTPPSGKTTGDFDAGRVADTANPPSAVDITADDYTELLFSIEAKLLSREVTYDFRVTKAGDVIDTYTVTPQVTITAGAATQNIYPSGIASGLAFGTATLLVEQTVEPSGIASTLAFGTATLIQEQFVIPSGIASGLTFGTAQINLQIIPSGIASTLGFGTPEITTLVTVLPTGIASTLIFGTPTIQTSITLYPSGIASTLVFGTPELSSAFQIYPSGIASTLAFGTTQLNLTIFLDGTTSSLAFGTAQIVIEQFVEPSGISSTLTFGTAIISVGGASQTIIPSGIGSTLAFGTAKLNLQILPSGISSSLGFGTATIEINVKPSGIGSTLAFGSPVVTVIGGPQYVVPIGISSGLTFGTPVLIWNQVVEPTGIASGLAFGTAIVRFDQTIEPNGIASTLVFGTPEIVQAQIISPSGIASGLSFGTLKITIEITNVGGIPSTLAFGIPTIVSVIQPNGIASTLSLGTPVVILAVGQTLYPNGIASTLVFGTPVVQMIAYIEELVATVIFTLELKSNVSMVSAPLSTDIIMIEELIGEVVF